jgi:hypothetical protein
VDHAEVRWQGREHYARAPAERADVIRYVAGATEVRFEGTLAELPETVDGLGLEELPGGALGVETGGRRYQIAARGWRVHEARPDFYKAELAAFAPTRAEARAFRLLLRLLRLPGGARLLRWWHGWRAR